MQMEQGPLVCQVGNWKDSDVLASLWHNRRTSAIKDPELSLALIRDANDYQAGIFDKPLPCFGCGVGWFSFLLGFVFPLMWYFATILYFGNYYRKDPRERAGLAASAIAALICTIAALITVLAIIF